MGDKANPMARIRSTKSQIAQQKAKPEGLGLDAIVPSLLSAMETIFAFLLLGAHM
jgi:hypothetical protein